MTENYAKKYIAEIMKLYRVSDADVEKMEENSEELNENLSEYWWNDVERAIKFFYVKKNDKSRPRLAQILALLETDTNVQKKVQPMPDVKPYQLPTTKIWSIITDFNRVIDVMVKIGLLKPENPDEQPATPRYSLLNADGELVVNPKLQLQWIVNDAKNARPDLFAKYPSLTFWEELAVAYQAGLVNLKLRDWSAAVKNMNASQRVEFAKSPTRSAGAIIRALSSSLTDRGM